MKIFRRAAAIALALVASQACSQARDWIALPLGATQDFAVEASGDRTARLPVRTLAPRAAGASKALDVRLLDIATKDGHGALLAQSFRVSWVSAQDHFDPAIVVTVPHDAAEIRPGTYTLSLRVSPDLDDDKLPAQALTVTLTAPAPQLTADPVVIGQSIGLWPFESDASMSGHLRVAERGGRSRVRALRVSVLEDVPTTGMPSVGSLAVSVAPPDIDSGQALALPIAASGPFPVGRSTGRIELRSLDLATPLSTTYEVRVVRSATWMIPIVLAGFLIGYVTRTWLARSKARSAAQLLASKAIASINARLAETDDDDFRRRVIASRKALAEVVALRVPEDIAAGAAKARADLDAEVTKLEQRLVPLRQRAAALQTLVNRPWTVPAPIASAMATLREDAAALDAFLARSNAGAVESALSPGVEDRLATLLNATHASGAAAARWMQDLAKCGLPLADADAALIRQSTTALAQQYPENAPDTTIGKVDDATLALSTYIGLSSVASKVLAQLAHAAESFADWTAMRLRPVFAQIDVELGPLKAKARALLDSAALERGMRGASADGLMTELATLRDDWMAALHRLARAVASTALDTAIREGMWEKAVEAARAMPSSQFLGGADSKALTAAPPADNAPTMQAPLADAAPAVYAPAVAFAPGMLTGTLAEQESLLHSGDVASWLQSAMLAALFLLANYVLYRESWVGTDKEIVTLFLVAFGLDLSADNVLAALKKA